MKIIITESQIKSLEETILDFFESNIMPEDGWLSTEQYKNEIKRDGREVFIHLENPEDDHKFHIWYSLCNNSNLGGPLDPKICPVVMVPKTVYDSLDGFFGDFWKPIFKKWFMKKTGLKFKSIDRGYD